VVIKLVIDMASILIAKRQSKVVIKVFVFYVPCALPSIANTNGRAELSVVKGILRI
jgi:hypothetical protein